ncbi:hypothetical protein OQH61_04555 [Helicobacter sp. MIT 21-1697]|nr:hypothetical protein [Helicobacter sp. MIT 21-1697]MCX2717004.1 hypothetical protein [Helicobacter sp. MIT 21-1697]
MLEREQHRFYKAQKQQAVIPSGDELKGIFKIAVFIISKGCA